VISDVRLAAKSNSYDATTGLEYIGSMQKSSQSCDDVQNINGLIAIPASLYLTPNTQKSSRIVDTLGHTSSPIFSVGCRFFSLFPGHTNGLQVLAYGINPVFSRFSWFALDVVVHLPIHGLLRYRLPCVVQYMTQPSQSSLMHDDVHFFQVCPLSDYNKALFKLNKSCSY